MSSDAATGRDHPPLDDEPQEQASAADASADSAFWAEGFADAPTNWFSDEIENVSASDWDEDTAQIWGDDSGSEAGDAGGLDFPL